CRRQISKTLRGDKLITKSGESLWAPQPDDLTHSNRDSAIPFVVVRKKSAPFNTAVSLMPAPQFIRSSLLDPKDLEKTDDALNRIGRIHHDMTDGTRETGLTELYSFIAGEDLLRVIRADRHQGHGPR